MSSLLNKAKVRALALSVAAKERPAAGFTRVGSDFLEAIESTVRIAITNRIKQHPSKGITLK